MATKKYLGGGGGGRGRSFASGGGGAPPDHKVLVDGADTTADYLAGKLAAGAGIGLTVLNPGGNEGVEISCLVPPPDHLVVVSNADTTPNDLKHKIVHGAHCTFDLLNPGGNEQIQVNAALPDDPIIWYKGDNSPADSIGNVDMLWAPGLTPAYVNGVYGRAFDVSFNQPANADYKSLSVPNNAKFNFTDADDFTIKLWVKITSAAPAYFPIVKGDVSGSFASNWGIYISGNIPAPGANLYLSMPSGFNHLTGLAIQDNDWHVICWNHYAGGTHRFLLDYRFGSAFLPGFIPIVNTAVELRLGCGWFGVAASFLDDVKIYNYIDAKP
jgi:hypothetical protein